jgi:hypothetical protein
MPQGTFAPLTHDDVPLRVKLRFVEHVWSTRAEDDECWLWPLSVASHGYGQIGWSDGDDRGLVLTHRLSFLMFAGPIPADMTVDHRCHTKRCWNPAHLRLLANVDNATDNGNATKTHCPEGHPYDEENTYVDGEGHRRCRACARARARSTRKAA